MVVIGHVDSGKSTLSGHLLYQLGDHATAAAAWLCCRSHRVAGCVDKKQMHKYEVESRQAGKASFMYAWVMDQHEEERARGEQTFIRGRCAVNNAARRHCRRCGQVL
jgi:elongation factor 1 alpha-like protein